MENTVNDIKNVIKNITGNENVILDGLLEFRENPNSDPKSLDKIAREVLGDVYKESSTLLWVYGENIKDVRGCEAESLMFKFLLKLIILTRRVDPMDCIYAEYMNKFYNIRCSGYGKKRILSEFQCALEEVNQILRAMDVIEKNSGFKFDFGINIRLFQDMIVVDDSYFNTTADPDMFKHLDFLIKYDAAVEYEDVLKTYENIKSNVLDRVGFSSLSEIFKDIYRTEDKIIAFKYIETIISKIK